MIHTRIRPFNTRDTYPEQNLDNDLCQAVRVWIMVLPPSLVLACQPFPCSPMTRSERPAELRTKSSGPEKSKLL